MLPVVDNRGQAYWSNVPSIASSMHNKQHRLIELIPHLTAEASLVSSGDAQMESELLQYTVLYPTTHFVLFLTVMKEPLEAFKAARLFSPSKINQVLML